MIFFLKNIGKREKYTEINKLSKGLTGRALTLLHYWDAYQVQCFHQHQVLANRAIDQGFKTCQTNLSTT